MVHIFTVIFLLVSVAAGAIYMKKLSGYAGELGLRFEEASMTRESVDAYWQEADQETLKYLNDITLYKDVGLVPVENTSLGRTVSARQLVTAGDMNQVYPGGLIKGSLITSGDRKGCVISTQLAKDLFSATEVLGETIQIDDDVYIIRGLIKCEEDVCMIQGGPDTGYDNICVSSQKMSSSAIMNALGGVVKDKETVKSEGDLYVGLAGMLCMLPFLILLFAAMFGIRRWYKKKAWKLWVKDVCTIAFLFLLAGAAALIFLSGFHFSADYLPPSWSDFSFWGTLWKEKAHDIMQVMTMEMSFRDRQMTGFFAGCAVAGVCADIGAVLVSRIIICRAKGF
jgi:hypothetical protein